MQSRTRRFRTLLPTLLGLLAAGGAVLPNPSVAAGPATAPAATRPAAKVGVPAKPYPAAQPADPAGPLDFRVRSIDGEERDLSAYDGYVVLMVNVASRCGLTPQYAGLQRLYDRYHDHRFVVLAFPANEFRNQEPDADEQIKAFATGKYKVTFPLMGKVVVRGDGIHPLYAYLTGRDTGGAFGGDVEWNFAKFLIGRDGKVLGRFPAKMVPEDPQVLAGIEAALGLTPEQVAALPPLPKPASARPATRPAAAGTPPTRPAAP